LLVQPIHPDGIARLEGAGIDVALASAPDMGTVAREIEGATAVITRNAGLDRRAIEAAPRLKVIGNHGVGLDPVDVARATELGVCVVSTPGANAQSVAELAVTLALAVAKQVRSGDAATRAGDFGFKYRSAIRELHGRVVGVIGFGRIGRRTAAILTAGFQMRPVVYAPSASDGAIAEVGGQRAHTLTELLERSDVVTLHVPLRDDTRHLLGAAELARCKPGAILVNTARGGLVDEDALAHALRGGRLAGAGLDVYATESMPRDHPLFTLDNVVLTPHVGGSSLEAAQRTAVQVADQVIDALAGRRPEHLVAPDVWERRR
jgi:D-3-phosphoglycerate dehydrogenase / 2-oxoglutarate reductase